MQTIKLTDYNIYVGDIWKTFEIFLKTRNYSKLVFIVDENTDEHCFPTVKKQLKGMDYTVIKIMSGEIFKTIDTCQYIWAEMMKRGVDRQSLCINLGGGVIGDMGGFCARTFKRGIDFVQMPTTLLSQVDASIGGKLGIDFNHIKNSIGVFANPQAVFIAPEFFKTLPKNEIRSGFGEIIKHSLIADATQWEKLLNIEDLNTVDWTDYLVPSLGIKKRIVEEDPFEKGIRKALNFGHTIGHAVESVALESDEPLLHGEAIAIGMVCEAWLSHHLADLSMEAVEQIADFIFKIYEPYELSPKHYDEYLHLMTKDKKNENNQINFTLINPIGTALINRTCEDELILQSLYFYNSRIPVLKHEK